MGADSEPISRCRWTTGRTYFHAVDERKEVGLPGLRRLGKENCEAWEHPCSIARIDRQRAAMQTLRQDISYALRQMRLSPVFTLTAMLTLALGIGATTAIFSLIHSVMLKSLPVVDPSSLYRVGDGNDCCVEGGPQDNWGMYTYSLYKRMKDASPEFEQMAAFQT